MTIIKPYGGVKLDVDTVKAMLNYDVNTGIFVWLVKRPKVNIGTVAGRQDKDGYNEISLFGKRYKAHRLAWFIMTGKWPTNQIDHINGDKTDNSWSNLREATKQQNMMNVPCRRHNKLGYKNIHSKVVGDYEYWGLSITHQNGKRFEKSYNKKLYSLEDVIKIRDDMYSEYHGEYANNG